MGLHGASGMRKSRCYGRGPRLREGVTECGSAQRGEECIGSNSAHTASPAPLANSKFSCCALSASTKTLSLATPKKDDTSRIRTATLPHSSKTLLAAISSSHQQRTMKTINLLYVMRTKSPSAVRAKDNDKKTKTTSPRPSKAI